MQNMVERFFNKIKQCRRIAARCDKLEANYHAFIKLASIQIWLRTYEPVCWFGVTGTHLKRECSSQSPHIATPRSCWLRGCNVLR